MTAHWDHIGKPNAISKALHETLMEAYKNDSLHIWHQSFFLRGLKNMAQSTPSFAEMFRNFVKSPFIWASQGVKAVAAYVVLNNTPAGAKDEPEAISQFTEKLATCIQKSERTGEPSEPYFNLCLAAAQMAGRHDVTQPIMPEHKARAVEILKRVPDIIDKTVTGNDCRAMRFAIHGLEQAHTPHATQQQLFQLICRRAMHVSNICSDNCEPLLKSLLKIERASELITSRHGEQVPRSLSMAWETTFNALYRYDPVLGVDWATNLLTRQHRPVHPYIRQAATNAVTSCTKPVMPSNVVVQRATADNYFALKVVGGEEPTPT